MLSSAVQLASVLATRLSYASWKVSHGWIQQSLSEVENLYSSRFRQQAAQRSLIKSSTKGKHRAGMSSIHDSDMYAPGAGAMVMADDSHMNNYSTYQPFGQADEQPAELVAPFAEANAPYSHLDNRQLQPPQLITTSSNPLVAGLVTPSMACPSPSMYAYIASPLVGGGSPSVGFGTPSQRTTTGPFANGYSSAGHITNTPRQYDDFWKGSIFNETVDRSGQSRNPASQILNMGDQSTQTGQKLGSPAISNHLRRASLAAAAAVPPQAAGQAAIAASTQQISGTAFKSGHQRIQSNASLRGDYSASHITMDDLDSQFGS